jgi:hypothetical protein
MKADRSSDRQRRSSASRPRAAAVALATVVGLLADGARADEEAPSAGVAARPTAQRSGSVFVDPLGFLLFGPRVGVEAGGDRLAGAIYGRWFDGGLLSHSLFLNDGDAFAFSWGAGVRGRYYLSEGQAGLHLGAGAEYIRSRVENQAALVATNASYLVGYAEAGYRFALGRFYAGAAAALGYAARVSGEVVDLPGGNAASSYEASNRSSVYGTGSLELGLYF